MYCRRCGKRLPENATRCEHCGTEVVEVKQRPYAEKYHERRVAEKAARAEERRGAAAAKAAGAEDATREAEVAARNAAAAGIKADPYVTPALACGVGALVCSAFPWPEAWGVGTSLWMRVLILALAVAGLVLGLLATKVENANEQAASAWNRGHKKRSVSYAKPTALLVARLCAGLAALMAALSFFAL